MGRRSVRDQADEERVDQVCEHVPQHARREVHSSLVAFQLLGLPVIHWWCWQKIAGTPVVAMCQLREANSLVLNSFELMPQCRQLSSFPDMKKKRMQMSTQDAFSLNTVPSFVLRTQRRDILLIIKTYIYQIQQSPPRRSPNRKSETKHFQL